MHCFLVTRGVFNITEAHLIDLPVEGSFFKKAVYHGLCQERTGCLLIPSPRRCGNCTMACNVMEASVIVAVVFEQEQRALEANNMGMLLESW